MTTTAPKRPESGRSTWRTQVTREATVSHPRSWPRRLRLERLLEVIDRATHKWTDTAARIDAYDDAYDTRFDGIWDRIDVLDDRHDAVTDALDALPPVPVRRRHPRDLS